MKKWNWKNKRKVTAEFRKTREHCRQRDPVCVRCYHLFDIISVDRLQCDHFLNVESGGDDSALNCWMICYQCHFEKTQLESNRITESFRIRFDEQGNEIAEPEWLKIIEEREKSYAPGINNIRDI